MADTIKLTYDDITIVPNSMTTISSRKECDPFIDGMLPIFTAPMDTVVDDNNYHIFLQNKINPVIPRTVSFEKRIELLVKEHIFISFSINECEKLKDTLRELPKESTFKICIDLANGHMTSLLALVKSLKDEFPNIVIMTGNIANPTTYRLYEEVGVDYCRVGIGGGEGCLTSSNTGVHYPYFSLLMEMYDIKTEMNGKCKIIADGNIRGYRDIQKALINADYVMIGGLFNRALESASKTTYGKSYFRFKGFRILRPFKTLFTYGRTIDDKEDKTLLERIKSGKLDVYKEFYGMSTKIAQEKMGNKVLKTSEGVVKRNKVEYSLKGWAENETDMLRSAMSYTNSYNLNDYKSAS